MPSPAPAPSPSPEGSRAASSRPIVAVAGATGFVGSALLTALTPRFRCRGLTRDQAPPAPTHDDDAPATVEWRRCDLFSLLELEQALAGADYAIYLVHSMSPGSRLTQGTFADLDLILADNFARAAARAGVKQILYLGGLIPAAVTLSPHLASRLEVECTLAAGPVPLTALRAGLIIGPGGSSLAILVNLVRRLPAMLLPRWTRTLTQPVALRDVVRAVILTLGDPAWFGRQADLGGADVMTYRAMMERTAAALDRRPLLLNVPFLSPRFSILWVTLFGGAPRALVAPLVASLQHPMVAAPNPLLTALAPAAQSFEAALRDAVDARGHLRPHPRTADLPARRAVIRAARRVRSVQRLPLPAHLDARAVAALYYDWLPRFVGPWLRVVLTPDGRCQFRMHWVNTLLLELTHAPERSTPDRQLSYITGGLLARTADNAKARLEFREMLDRRCILAAIHDFAPTLPWYLYNATQALAHLVVMRAFGRHLARIRPG